MSNLLTLIMVWGLPALALQWLVALDALLVHWRVWLLGMLGGLFYWLVLGALLVAAGVWLFNPTQTSRVELPLFNLPIEWLWLGLILNLLLVQSVILAMYSGLLRRRLVSFWGQVRRGPPAQ
jgi:hypothetical protein